MMNNKNMGNFLVVSSRKGVKRNLPDNTDDSQLLFDTPICKVKKGELSTSSNVRVATGEKLSLKLQKPKSIKTNR